MRGERLVHDVSGDVVTLREVPQQPQHLVGHDALLVVLRQATDQLQQLLTLLLGRVLPAHL